jgi:transcriptional regulator with XRE-family HTH domain
MPKLSSIFGRVSEDELKRVMQALKQWAKQGHGRQKQIADAIGVTEPTLSNWIAGRKRPSLAKFFALREFLQKAKKS